MHDHYIIEGAPMLTTHRARRSRGDSV